MPFFQTLYQCCLSILLFYRSKITGNSSNFRATVVKSQKEFWVKSIKSKPIPPCRIEREGMQGYIPDPITPPPPVRNFAHEVI